MDHERDFSFMADPGQVTDWRLVLLADTASTSGLLGALPGRAPDLAARLDLDPRATTVVLDALVTFGLVARTGDDDYTLGSTELSADALASLNHHARVIGQWTVAVGARLRGEEVARSAGPPDPARWLDSLAVGGRRAAPGVVAACVDHAPDAKTVLDLGGCHGEYSLEFARRGLAVTMQDRPVMIDVVRERGDLEAAGIELFAGDFFETMPAGPFDLVFCSGVTNTFGPDRNRALYPRVRSALSPAGTFVINTSFRGESASSDLFSVQMLATGGGGGSHPEADYRAWLTEAGFGPATSLSGGNRSMLAARPA